MKVLHLSSETSWRGGEQQIAYLIEHLNLHKIENVVLAKKNSAFAEYCNANEIHYYTSSFRNALDLITVKNLLNVANREKPDVIHLHASKSHGIAALASLIGIKTPMIVSRRVIFLPKNNFIGRWKYNLPTVKKILCVSDYVKSVMQKVVKDHSLLETVYSGVKIKELNPDTGKRYLKKKISINKEHVVVGNVSALSSEKDLFTFIDTAQSLCTNPDNEKLIFVIMGTGKLRKELEIYIQSKRLENRIHLIGFMDNVHQVLSEFDYFLFTASEEGLGTSVLDAFSLGIPVISTNAGGLKELVIHEKTGLSADVGDYQELAQHLKRLLVDEQLKNSLVTNAFHHVLKFSIDEMAKKTLAAYHDAIQGS